VEKTHGNQEPDTVMRKERKKIPEEASEGEEW
jgi:hypothetical protein